MTKLKAILMVVSSLVTLLIPAYGFSETNNQLAELIKQELPKSLLNSESATVQITLKNTGSAPWISSSLELVVISKTNWSHKPTTTLNTNETINVGEEKTFSIAIKAPNETGHLPFEWQLKLNTKPILTYQGKVLVENNSHRAQFVSQLFPSQVNPGEPFKVIMQYRNTGKTSWDGQSKKYVLAAAATNSQNIWGVDKVYLENSKTILSDDIATFTFTVTAPLTSGSYPFQWTLNHSQHGAFGELSPESFINVGSRLNDNKLAIANAEFIATHVEESMNAGGEYDVTVIFKNSGETTWWAGNTYLVSESPRDNLTWFINQVDYTSTGTTPPNDIYAFRFSVRAPEDTGLHNFQWQMINSEAQQAFGEKSELIKINVTPR